MITVEEYFPEPGRLRYLVKRDGLLLFGLWPEELAELKTALQSFAPDPSRSESVDQGSQSAPHTDR